MTREEMIRKVCEFAAYDCYGYEGEMGFLFCLSCNADPIKDSLYGKDLVHEPDCPVILARKLLAKPVIEVGDVVALNDRSHEFTVMEICIKDRGEPIYRCHDKKDQYITCFADELYLVRKGSKP